MTNEELLNVIREGDPDNAGLMELWKQNSGIVRKACMKYSGYIEQEDALQECFIAFLDAVNDYNPINGKNFAGYVYNRCRWHLHRYYENCGGMIRIPADQRQKMLRYNRFTREYYQKRGELPSDRTICAMLQIGPDQLRQLRKDLYAVKQVQSLDASLSEDDQEEGTLYDVVENEAVDVEGDSIKETFEEQRRQAVRAAVNTLNPKEQQAIQMYYWDRLTYKQIGEAAGVTGEMIRARIARGMRRLRTGKQRNLLRQYIERSEIYSAALRGGSQMFRRSWTSSTERIAVQNVMTQETKRQDKARAEQLRRDAIRVYGASQEEPDAAPSAGSSTKKAAGETDSEKTTAQNAL